MDNTPFRETVLDKDGKHIGHIAWRASDKSWGAYRYAGQPPIGRFCTKEEARMLVAVYAQTIGE
jgi:hypothetical protein